MKSTDIPNGAVVKSPSGMPILIDFDENGEPLLEGTELESDAWLGKGRKGMPDNIVALVHTVKGDDRMLVKALVIVQLADKSKKPIAASELGKNDKLLDFLKNLRKSYMERKNHENTQQNQS